MFVHAGLRFVSAIMSFPERSHLVARSSVAANGFLASYTEDAVTVTLETSAW